MLDLRGVTVTEGADPWAALEGMAAVEVVAGIYGRMNMEVSSGGGGGVRRGCRHCPASVLNALEGKRPQRRPQKWLDGRLEEAVQAVGGRCCGLQKPLKLALAVRGTVAGPRPGALDGGGVWHKASVNPPPLLRTSS